MSEDNKYEYLEDLYDDLPRNVRIQRSPSKESEGTADSRRSNRDRTIKKTRELMRKLKEVQDESGTKEW